MRICCLWTSLLLWTAPLLTVCAEIQIVPSSVQHVFGGAARQIGVQVQNSSDAVVLSDVRAVISQVNSATIVRLCNLPWKKLQVLPGQTIVEAATLNFPSVKAKTRFLIQWTDGASNVVGRTDVFVYPTNLLAELTTLVGADEGALGVFDPPNQIKSPLKGLGVVFSDLENEGLQSFRGHLAIVGPFTARTEICETVSNQIEAMAKRGVAVVWLQSSPEERDKLQPSFYPVSFGRRAVVVAGSELVANLSESPQSQLNLIRCARLALRPEPVRLPYLTLQP